MWIKALANDDTTLIATEESADNRWPTCHTVKITTSALFQAQITSGVQNLTKPQTFVRYARQRNRFGRARDCSLRGISSKIASTVP